MASPSQSLRVTFNGKTQVIGPLREESRVLDLQQLLAEATSLAPSTLKLFLSGTNRGVLRLEDVPGSTLAEAGCQRQRPIRPSLVNCKACICTQTVFAHCRHQAWKQGHGDRELCCRA